MPDAGPLFSSLTKGQKERRNALEFFTSVRGWLFGAVMRFGGGHEPANLKNQEAWCLPVLLSLPLGLGRPEAFVACPAAVAVGLSVLSSSLTSLVPPRLTCLWPFTPLLRACAGVELDRLHLQRPHGVVLHSVVRVMMGLA